MNGQEALFGYRVVGTDRDHPLARFSDPPTSHMADEQLRRREGGATEIRRGTHRHRALECFERLGPLIAEDVKLQTGVDGIWKRVSDLKNMNLIAPTGHTRLSREGREADIYEITESGREALRTLK